MYKPLFGMTGLFAIGLGCVLLIAPNLYLSLYLPVEGPQTAFAAQRLAPAVIGLGALLVLARDLPAGRFASRFAGLAALVWFGVAATGVFHFVTGIAGFSILIAATTEVGLGILFLLAAWQMHDG